MLHGSATTAASGCNATGAAEQQLRTTPQTKQHLVCHGTDVYDTWQVLIHNIMTC
jgi:hypothetical protein